jgi:hypothetical protein
VLDSAKVLFASWATAAGNLGSVLTTTVLELLPFQSRRRLAGPHKTSGSRLRAMLLYVCWDTRLKHPVLGDHPCGIAHKALVDAGHDPEVKLAFGWNKLPSIFNQTSGRRAAKELTGSIDVPVLALDDGEIVSGSEQIVFWAEANPAPRSS